MKYLFSILVFILMLVCCGDAARAAVPESPLESYSNTVSAARSAWRRGEYWQARSLYDHISLEKIPVEMQPAFLLERKDVDAWWYKYLLNRVLFLFCILCISLGMYLAVHGHTFTIRRIPGLDQIREAVGRATEMGRPSLFCIGVSNMDHPETFAAMPILSHIARIGAVLRNRLLIPVCAERTLTLQQTTYREACQSIGELRAYNPSDVRFFPGGQVYFTAATMGYMLRERPAACFYFGYYEAESLLLSETGQVIGAMQIAGTSQLYQIPFFIATCDYVIIGEEFFAVSASLSKDPILCGSLFGQDVVKLMILLTIVAGTIAISFSIWAIPLRSFINLLVH